MWVFIRPRGGQDCYLLTCEIRGWVEFCPIHRFDGMDQNLMRCSGTHRKIIFEKNSAFVPRKKTKNEDTNLTETPLFAGDYCKHVTCN